MQSLKSGTRVQISGLGMGEVVRTTRKGVIVSVDTAGGIKIELPISKVFPLEQIDSTQKVTTSIIDSNINNAISQDIYSLRMALEALRFGLVPISRIDSLSIGFQEMENWVISCLPQQNNGKQVTSIVQGPFGTGKSHAMAVIRYVASKNNYLVARVEVDGQNISLFNPEKLLSSLWSTLSSDDFFSATPLLDLYVKAVDRGCPPPRIVSSGMDRIRENYIIIQSLRRSGLVESYSSELDVIISSGDECSASEVNRQLQLDPKVPFSRSSLKRIIDNKVSERPNCFVQSLVGHAIIAKLAGYRGLVITVDEFEVETNLTKTNLLRVYNLLSLLLNYFNGASNYTEAPLAVFWSTIGDLNNVNEIILNKMVGASEGKTYELKTWEKQDLLLLASKIHHLYRDAYMLDKPFSNTQANKLIELLVSKGYCDNWMIRAFIKYYIMILDMRFGPPGDDEVG